MEFNEVENLSEEQIAELYSDVVQGPEPVLLSASYTYSSESLGLYYINDAYGYWICERFTDYGCSTIGYNHFFDECYAPANGHKITINEYTAICDYGPVK